MKVRLKRESVMNTVNTQLELEMKLFLRMRFVWQCVVLGFLLAAVAPPGRAATLNYISAYDSALQGDWVTSAWENQEGDIAINLNAAAPGRTGKAIEVSYNGEGGYGAFGLADRKPGWIPQYKYFNETKSVEFDIYFEPGSDSVENLHFILEDAFDSDEPNLGDLIPDWNSYSGSERFGKWFHVAVDLAAIHPTINRFAGFLIFNDSGGAPHYRIMNIKLGWTPDLTTPVVTLLSSEANLSYNEVTLNFATDEATTFRVDYGIGNYNKNVQGDADAWDFSHNVKLAGLAPGATVQYRITATGHRIDTASTTSKGQLLGSFALPPAPTSPPAISNITVVGITGSRAEVQWSIERPCVVAFEYQRPGGPKLARSFSEFQAMGSAVLDLLEPLMTYSVTFKATDAFGFTATNKTTFTTTAASVPTVTINVNATQEHPISPWIYGINFYENVPDAPANLTLNRAGGNRWTAYNWENNASNAGSDYGPYQSDDYLMWTFDPNLPTDVPGDAMRVRVAADRARGMASLITIPMQGYVAIDKDGTKININDPNAISQHFKQLVYAKNAPFTATPSLNDAFVYADESVWALRGKFPTDIFADPMTPTFLSLDNEPDLWTYTHKEIQKNPITVSSFIQKTIALSTALKNVDPAAKIFGPAHYGFAGIQSLQEQPGFSVSYWFTDKYLTDLKAASETAGHRLLDVYDIHWYSSARWPEAGAYDSVTSLTGTNLTASQIQALVQSPRSLWDTTFSEDSWINRDFFNGPIYILPRLQEKINSNWPGTKLAITEYENGGGAHIAGAIAQADNLGVFGQMDLFAATLWPLTGNYPFLRAGFKMYRDYDHNKGSFGDISIATVSSATEKVAAYVSRDSAHAGRYVIVALNRSFDAQDVAFNGLSVSGQAKVYRLQGKTPDPAYVGEVPANLANWVVTLPPLSVSTIEITQPQAARAQLRALAPTTAGQFKFALDGTVGKKYTIVTSANLTAWQNAQDVTLQTASQEITLTSNGAALYFQAVETP